MLLQRTYASKESFMSASEDIDDSLLPLLGGVPVFLGKKLIPLQAAIDTEF